MRVKYCTEVRCETLDHAIHVSSPLRAGTDAWGELPIQVTLADSKCPRPSLQSSSLLSELRPPDSVLDARRRLNGAVHDAVQSLYATRARVVLRSEDQPAQIVQCPGIRCLLDVWTRRLAVGVGLESDRVLGRRVSA